MRTAQVQMADGVSFGAEIRDGFLDGTVRGSPADDEEVAGVGASVDRRVTGVARDALHLLGAQIYQRWE